MWRKGLGAALVIFAVLSGVWVAAHREPAPPAPVPVAAKPEPKALSLSATIEPLEVTLVAAPVDGTVESFVADVGQEVAQGQLLGTMRNQALASARETAVSDAEHAQTRLTTLESTLIADRLEASRAGADSARARSEYDQAQRHFERQSLLQKEGATPRLTYEKAEKDFQTAKRDLDSLETLARQAEERVATVQNEITVAKRGLEEKNKAAEGAQSQLAAAEIRSPVDGLILKRSGQPGDEVSRQTKDLFQIVTNLSRLRVAADLPSGAARRVHPGVPCTLTAAESTEPIVCEVKQVEAGRVVAEFTSPTPAIRPGLSAQLVMRLE